MHQLFVRSNTDTAHPQSAIPIYFVHMIQNPFCQKPGCWCQNNKTHIYPLLTAIQTGTLTVQEAVTFHLGEGGIHEP